MSAMMVPVGLGVLAQTHPVTHQGLGANHDPAREPPRYREPDTFSYVLTGVLFAIIVAVSVSLFRLWRKKRRRVREYGKE